MAKRKQKQSEKLQESIRIAEESVKIMTDPALKGIAFKTILESLLGAEKSSAKREVESQDEDREIPAENKKQKVNRKSPTGPKGRIELLIEDGFFIKQRTIGDVKKELENRTWYHNVSDLNPTLQRLVRAKALRRVKTPEKAGGKLIWRYSNW